MQSVAESKITQFKKLAMERFEKFKADWPRESAMIKNTDYGRDQHGVIVHIIHLATLYIKEPINQVRP